MCPGAEAEIDAVAILASGYRRLQQRATLGQEQTLFGSDGRPLRRFPPSFAMHREVMHRRFPLEPGLESPQVAIEKPQQLAVE